MFIKDEKVDRLTDRVTEPGLLKSTRGVPLAVQTWPHHTAHQTHQGPHLNISAPRQRANTRNFLWCATNRIIILSRIIKVLLTPSHPLIPTLDKLKKVVFWRNTLITQMRFLKEIHCANYTNACNESKVRQVLVLLTPSPPLISASNHPLSPLVHLPRSKHHHRHIKVKPKTNHENHTVGGIWYRNFPHKCNNSTLSTPTPSQLWLPPPSECSLSILLLLFFHHRLFGVFIYSSASYRKTF